MSSADVLIDAFGRIREAVHEAVDGLRPDDLAYQLDESANSIAWLVWHLTRVQDDHVAEVAGLEQVWTRAGLGGPVRPAVRPVGHRLRRQARRRGAVRVSGELLAGYHDEVYDQTIEYVRGLTDDDLPRIVDDRWDPPVTLSVRLVSVVSDDLQHAGQAAFLRGFLLRR